MNARANDTATAPRTIGSVSTFVAALLAATLCLAGRSLAEDWPQWRGPRRDGVSDETIDLSRWPEESSPKIAWRAQVGKGHSSVSIAGGRAYVAGWDGENDTVYCFDAATGKAVWRQSYPCRTILQWPGPRATPTVHEGAVYTLGQHGQLRAWDAATGVLRWERDLPAKFQPDVDYGFAWSPLIVGGALVLNSGSGGTTFRLADGSTVREGDGQRGACVSPVPYEREGRREILFVSMTPERDRTIFVGVDATTGEERWRFGGWKEQWGALGVDPVIRDGAIFVTSAETFKRAARFRIAGDSLVEDWSTAEVSGYTGAATLVGNAIYLVDSIGVLRCVDWETGETHWAERGFDERGSQIAVGETLLIQTGASGELVAVVADPTAFRELRRLKVFDRPGTTFTAPSFADGRIYCRSYEGEVACVDLGR